MMEPAEDLMQNRKALGTATGLYNSEYNDANGYTEYTCSSALADGLEFLSLDSQQGQ